MPSFVSWRSSRVIMAVEFADVVQCRGEPKPEPPQNANTCAILPGIIDVDEQDDTCCAAASTLVAYGAAKKGMGAFIPKCFANFEGLSGCEADGNVPTEESFYQALSILCCNKYVYAQHLYVAHCMPTCWQTICPSLWIRAGTTMFCVKLPFSPERKHPKHPWTAWFWQRLTPTAMESWTPALMLILRSIWTATLNRHFRRKIQISYNKIISVVTRHWTFWSRITGEVYSPAKLYYHIIVLIAYRTYYYSANHITIILTTYLHVYRSINACMFDVCS